MGRGLKKPWSQKSKYRDAHKGPELLVVSSVEIEKALLLQTHGETNGIAQ
jgi:hypothetical protein